MLINVKMPTIVGILTFMSRINFALEHGQSFITWGPVDYSLVLLLYAAKAKTSQRQQGVSPEPPLFTHMTKGCR